MNLDLKISYKPQYLQSDYEETVRDIIFKEKIGKSLSSNFHLEDIYQKRVKTLSGGELQRLSIARCLAKEADIYLIDEPSAYLDVEERISLAKTIKDFMMEQEKICFVVDHDLLLISYLADSIIVFSGEPGKQGKSSEIFTFERGISELLKSLDITLRKDKDSGRPRINKKDSVLDREQKQKGNWAIF
jgi:ATP-binding cassette, sub-family E, member 1